MEINSNVRLAGIDLDGTLLNDEKQLCFGALETIKRARKKGIELVPVTGRPLNGIPECVRNIEEINYIICSNGAKIVDAKTENTLYSCSMSNEKSCEIFTLLKGVGCIFEPFADGVCYTEQEILDSYIGYFRGSPIEEYLLSTRVICDSIEELFFSKNRCADEFFVSCTDAGQRIEVTNLLDKTPGVQYWFYDNRYIEITRRGCDKGESLAWLCKYLNIDIKDTIAFGDGDNDLSFLKKAGVAVAMGNAFPSVKEKADIIAKNNNDNGVCEILEKLI